jgi:hypothetical protein
VLRGVLAPALASIEPFAIPSTFFLGAGAETEVGAVEDPMNCSLNKAIEGRDKIKNNLITDLGLC